MNIFLYFSSGNAKREAVKGNGKFVAFFAELPSYRTAFTGILGILNYIREMIYSVFEGKKANHAQETITSYELFIHVEVGLNQMKFISNLYALYFTEVWTFRHVVLYLLQVLILKLFDCPSSVCVINIKLERILKSQKIVCIAEPK